MIAHLSILSFKLNPCLSPRDRYHRTFSVSRGSIAHIGSSTGTAASKTSEPSASAAVASARPRRLQALRRCWRQPGRTLQLPQSLPLEACRSACHHGHQTSLSGFRWVPRSVPSSASCLGSDQQALQANSTFVICDPHRQAEPRVP